MEMTDMMDDSLDGGPPSVGSGEMMGTSMSLGIASAPVSAKKVGSMTKCWYNTLNIGPI